MCDARSMGMATPPIAFFCGFGVAASVSATGLRETCEGSCCGLELKFTNCDECEVNDSGGACDWSWSGCQEIHIEGEPCQVN
jgi:hypothetical protein